VITIVLLTNTHSIILETGIVACHLIWLFRSRRVRQRAKAQGMTFDEFVQACGEEEHGFEFKERTFRSKEMDPVDISP
jgi:Flp pilus assembly protein TadB